MDEEERVDTIVIRDKVVVFDYGEVISVVPSPADRAELVALAGAEEQPFWAAYWRHRDALDSWQIDAGEYWRRIGRELGADWPPALLHALWLADLRGWMRINPDVLDILLSLQRGGTRMALLSNAGRDYVSYFRHGMLGDFFEQVFVSGELGTLKPGADIFRTMLAGLGVDASQVLFVDNRADNLEGAARLGIQGHVFTTAGELRGYLVSQASNPE
jgi:putative hydrolase of the HAD superfamily